jgi:hypothetical protein
VGGLALKKRLKVVHEDNFNLVMGSLQDPIIIHYAPDCVSLLSLACFHMEEFCIFITMLKPVSSGALLPLHFFPI